jgi:hypothetical protein
MTRTRQPKSKPKPEPEAPASRYLLVCDADSNEPSITGFSTRPTQQFIKDDLGEGVYHLLKGDGTLLKIFTVWRNQKGNLSINSEVPADLRVISTIRLHRVLKAMQTAAKYWPAKTADVRKVEAEIQSRTDLLGRVA